MTKTIEIQVSDVNQAGGVSSVLLDVSQVNLFLRDTVLISDALLDFRSTKAAALITGLLPDTTVPEAAAVLIDLGDDMISHELVINLSDFSDNLNNLIIDGGHEDRVKLADGAARWQKDQSTHQVDGVNFEKYTATTVNNETVNVFISEYLSNTILE